MRPEKILILLAACLSMGAVVFAQNALQPSREPLLFDAMTKEMLLKPGEYTAEYTFSVTNNSPQDITVNWVRTSCGCTIAKLPPTPWKLVPGDHGQIGVTVDLRGKFGIVSKYVTVDTTVGQRNLIVKTTLPGPASSVAGVDNRARNMQIAAADRQAVFRGDCASCHATPAIGRRGEALYQAACAVCHDSPHRATMVPDLTNLKTPATRESWDKWVRLGRPGSLMPAFAQSEGGILSDAQVESLVEYLTHYFPPRPGVFGVNPVNPAAAD